MNKTLVTVNGLGITLAAAGTATADEAGFIEAVDSVGHYSTVHPDEAVQVAYQVYKAFDRGGQSADFQEVMKAHNSDDSSSRTVVRHAHRAAGRPQPLPAAQRRDRADLLANREPLEGLEKAHANVAYLREERLHEVEESARASFTEEVGE